MSSSSHTYRVGVIGTGRIGSEWDSVPPIPMTHAGMFVAHPKTTLVAGANRSKERLESFGRKWGITALYQDYREMLDREKLDIVSVATHPELHHEQVLAATQAGVKAIFCEKPFAISLAEADDMIDACKRAGTLLVTNHSRRWDPRYRKALEIVREGAIGQLVRVEGHCLGCKPFPAWRADEEGPLLHDATHLFDLFRMFAGDADWVIATATQRLRPLPVEDESLSLFQFRSGITGSASVDELTEYHQFDFTLVGTHGRIVLANGVFLLWGAKRSPQMEREKDPNIDWWDLDPRPTPAVAPAPTLKGAAEDLINCLETGQTPLSTGEDGRASLEMIMGIYESERRGNAKVSFPLPSAPSPLHAMREEGFYPTSEKSAEPAQGAKR